MKINNTTCKLQNLRELTFMTVDERSWTSNDRPIFVQWTFIHGSCVVYTTYKEYFLSLFYFKDINPVNPTLESEIIFEY